MSSNPEMIYRSQVQGLAYAGLRIRNHFYCFAVLVMNREMLVTMLHKVRHDKCRKTWFHSPRLT